jgi:predicted acyltransferase
MNTELIQKPDRLVSIDQFRGFAIVLMVLANFMGGINSVPAYLKHAHDIGLTLIDLIAPFFIFAIGLTYGISFRRRAARDGLWKAIDHFLRRWLALFGIGALMVAVEIAFYDPTETNWGVLQAIGVAGLLTLPLLRLPTWGRAAAGVGLLVVYQVLLDNFWLAGVLGSPHGGLPGSFSWTAMLILSTVLADLFHDAPRGRSLFPWVSLVVLGVGMALAFWLPVSKNRVSSTYVLISLGASALLFWLFHWFCDVRGLQLELLSVWGENPLVLYVLHYVLLGFLVLPPLPFWHVEAPLCLVAIQAAALLATLTWIGLVLRRKKWIFSL